MAPYISYNGNILPEYNSVLPFQNRSFRYGDGFFETIRVGEGKILWADRHYQRVIKSAKLLGMKLAEGFSPGHFQDLIYELYIKNHPAGSSARVRFSFFRNPGGYYSPLDNQAGYFIESSVLENDKFELNKKGLMISVYPDLKKSMDFLSGVKSSSALLYVMAGLYCKNHNSDDCIILNNEGTVAEALSSNLFIVKDNELITPAADQGCVHGIMRSVILDIASELQIKAHEVILTTSDLEDADEIFLTNTIQGIQWVAGFRSRRYFKTMSTVLIKALNQKTSENSF